MKSNNLSLNLELVTLNIHKGEYLTDALERQGYPFLPSNAIINKVVPGCGATYGELNAKRNSILIEPYVPVIKGKSVQFPDALAVHQGVTVKNIVKYITDNNIPFKKIITTPEGLIKKLPKAFSNAKINQYADYHCIQDEMDRVTLDTGYRRTVSDAVKEFMRYSSKTMISATPIKPMNYTIDIFRQNGFRWIDVIPDYDYREDLTLITTSNFHQTVRGHIENLKDSGSDGVLLFYASTMGISNIIHNLIRRGTINEDEYQVFCADESVEKLKEDLLINTSTDFVPQLKFLNAFTSRFFTAVDMDVSKEYDIIILSNYNDSRHSLIDPYTQTIQIQGRLRHIFPDGKRFKSLTVIANIHPNMELMDENDLDIDIQTRSDLFQDTLKRHAEAVEPAAKRRLEKEMEAFSYNEITGFDGEIDRFAIEQLIYKEHIKSLYISNESLLEGYSDTNFFNITTLFDSNFIGEDGIELINKYKGNIKKIKILNLLDKLDCDATCEDVKTLKSGFTDLGWLIDAYFIIGKEPIINAEYSKTAISKLVQQHKNEEYALILTSPEFLQEVSNEFAMELNAHTPIINSEIQDRLSKIYDKFEIEYSRRGERKSSSSIKITNDTIDSYFVTTKDGKIGGKRLIELRNV